MWNTCAICHFIAASVLVTHTQRKPLKCKPYGKSLLIADASTQIKVFCHLISIRTTIIKQQSLSHTASRLNPPNFTSKCGHYFPPCFIYIVLYFSYLSHSSSRNQNVLRRAAQLWHSRVVFYASPFIACHYFNILVPPPVRFTSQQSMKELQLGSSYPHSHMNGQMCGWHFLLAVGCWLLALPAFNVFQLFLLAYHKL